MPEPNKPIAALFKEIQEGSSSAFDILFLAYYNKLLAFAQQYIKQPQVAEEITSEMFVKIWLKRNTLSHIINPEVYLFIAIKNACLNHIRNDKKHHQHIVAEEETGHADVLINDQGTVMEGRELRGILDQAITTLPEQRKIIFKLIKEDGFKCKEAAEILGISVRTVESQLYKAIKTLAEALSGYLGYHPQKQNLKKKKRYTLFIIFFL